MRRLAALLVLAAACGGGRTADPEVPELDVEPPGAAPAASTAPVEPVAPAEIEARPAPAAPADVYVHDPSGTWFPSSAGAFERGNVTVYDPDGLDVGVAYAAGAELDGTVFIYPSDRDPPDPIEAVKYAIEYHHPEARLLDEHDVAIDLGELGLRGDYVAYRVADEVSVGYVFQHDTWNLKYRFRYPASADRAAAQRDIDSLLQSVRWR